MVWDTKKAARKSPLGFQAAFMHPRRTSGGTNQKQLHIAGMMPVYV
ncbi:hypothetical protein TREVI0001_0721 [Treponema vincentii ATCC 35580]|uniref:Uncharacterized protein n=1 Tax=Treponema vincentii ATCC 35580 TaxID=596324 RepID=C8PMU4_9SPIR|nr:hypothetical protein TREVI0001_0721 [Treponema vincentii ATCC 35580]